MKDEADLPVADFCPEISGSPAQFIAIHKVITAGGAVKTAENIHQRAFAGTGCSHQSDIFAPFNGKRHPFKH